LFTTDRGLVVHPRTENTTITPETPFQFKFVANPAATFAIPEAPRTTYFAKERGNELVDPEMENTEEGRTVHIKKIGLKTSTKKLNEVAYAIGKEHVYDAMAMMEFSLRKPA
jgi:hypothetical protein